MPDFVAPLILVGAAIVAVVIVMWANREAQATRRRGEVAVDEQRRLVSETLERAREAERQAVDDRREAGELVGAAEAELARIAGLTQAEAAAEMTARVVAEAGAQAAGEARRTIAKARLEAEDQARRIIVTAAQRLAAPTSSQAALSLVRLPSEEMKGRIIGKEGRNIRTFEALTGVNLIIDDTPQTVTLSCFDPERREVAQVALEKLVADGRIHPQRIEDAYRLAQAGADERAVAAGRTACEAARIEALDPELVLVLGRLRLRTSFGQNVLDHLVEVSLLAAQIAAELGADVEIARRAGFLHDIGKATSARQSGTHAAVGARLADRCGESPQVVHAIAAHHDEIPPTAVEDVIIQVSDAMSAARLGARRDDMDQFVERMVRLERLVAQHAGVAKVLAMSAGREVRVLVEPAEVDDAGTRDLAAAIAKHIEAELHYPGEIKVTAIRELRAEAVAG